MVVDFSLQPLDKSSLVGSTRELCLYSVHTENICPHDACTTGPAFTTTKLKIFVFTALALKASVFTTIALV